jgi:3-oxoacyl-[acyl-carrier protein] reductase
VAVVVMAAPKNMKRVLVTGAGRGIGQEVARLFAARGGYEVLALDRNWSSCTLPTSPGGVQRVDFDLRDTAAIAPLVASLGDVHVLVNNAGYLVCPSPVGLTAPGGGGLGFSAADVDDILGTNLRAPVALLEALAPQWAARHADAPPEAGGGAGGAVVGGRAVNVGSVSAFTGHPDLWYGASKAALLNITKTFAGLLGKYGVVVNAVAPGPTLTDMYEGLPQSRKDMVMRSVHSGRPAMPVEVAQAVLWLGTESPLYVNGTTLDVNDGSYPR